MAHSKSKKKRRAAGKNPNASGLRGPAPKNQLALAPSGPTSVREAWFEALRTRTLPLAVAGSLVAAGIAYAQGVFRGEVLALMAAVAMLLQVIANFADEYGDLASGLDDETRVGPRRGMQAGLITPAQMRRALIGLCVVTIALGTVLIYVALSGGPAFAFDPRVAAGVLLGVGILAIWAAVAYTVGKRPYGYVGLGDIMSFVFFGLVSVVAGSFLYTHELDPRTLVPGTALGLLVMAVMHVNNMRDADADRAKGKVTIANKLGPRRMRVYYAVLVNLSAMLFVAYLVLIGHLSITGVALLLISYAQLLRCEREILAEPDNATFDRFMAPTSGGAFVVAFIYMAILMANLPF